MFLKLDTEKTFTTKKLKSAPLRNDECLLSYYAHPENKIIKTLVFFVFELRQASPL